MGILISWFFATISIAGSIIDVFQYKAFRVCFILWSFSNTFYLFEDIYNKDYARALQDVILLFFSITGMLKWGVNDAVRKFIFRIQIKKSFHKEYVSKNPEQTQKIAYLFAKNLQKGDVIVLSGHLGAGKTVFVKGVAKALKINETITSPTFTLSNIYKTKNNLPNLVHVDAYRLSDEKDLSSALETLDLDSSIEDSITVIEWGKSIDKLLNQNIFYISIDDCKDASTSDVYAVKRQIKITREK